MSYFTINICSCQALAPIFGTLADNLQLTFSASGKMFCDKLSGDKVMGFMCLQQKVTYSFIQTKKYS